MNWLRRFLSGRYGADQLTLALLILYFILLLLSYIPGCFFLSWAGFALVILSLLRTLSRNTVKRYRENQVFLRYWNPVKNWLKRMQTRFQNRKVYRYYKCPSCKQKMRVPKGRGKIKITCPKCRTEFVKKT